MIGCRNSPSRYDVFFMNSERERALDEQSKGQTLSARCKWYGLKSVEEAAELADQSRQNLNNWWNKDREFCEVVLMGCAEKKKIARHMNDKNE